MGVRVDLFVGDEQQLRALLSASGPSDRYALLARLRSGVGRPLACDTDLHLCLWQTGTLRAVLAALRLLIASRIEPPDAPPGTVGIAPDPGPAWRTWIAEIAAKPAAIDDSGGRDQPCSAAVAALLPGRNALPVR